MNDRSQVLEAERARLLTSRYHQVRGLLFVPWGVALILLAFTTGSVVSGTGWWVVLGLFLASIPAAGVLTWLSTRYYRRRFGEVHRKPESVREVLGWLVAFGVLGVLLWIMRAFVGETSVVSPVGLMGGAIIAMTAWRMGRFARHRLALAGLVALVSVLPLGLLTDSGRHPFENSVYLPATYGLVLVVIGLVDHWLLARTFDSRTGQG